MREKLAILCHEQWSGWMKYLFSKCIIETRIDKHGLPIEPVIVIPNWAVERWKKQMNMPYYALSEKEKESDRKEADKFLDLLT